MARKRMIDPDFWVDEKLGKCTRDERLLFMGLISQADDEGRGRANPMLVKSMVFPYDPDIKGEDVEQWLRNMDDAGLIQLYIIDNQEFYWLPNFKKHQTINRPSESKLPPPPSVTENKQFNDNSVNNHGSIIEPSLLKEKNIKEKESISYCYSDNTPSEPVDNVDNSHFKQVIAEYTSCGYGTINHTTGEILQELVDEYSAEWVCAALRVGLEQGKRTLSYVKGVLENWKREGGIRLEKPKKSTTRDRPKNKFHNFDQPMLNYTKEQLDEILFKRKDRGG